MKIKTLLVCLGLVGFGLVGACGKNSPTSPTGPVAVVGAINPTTSAAAMNISGRVGSGSGFGSSAMSMTSGLVSGLVVTATGTAAASLASSPVDANGHFQLAVPPGPAVELHFTAPGVDAMADLGAVAEDEKVDVLVNVAPANPNADLEVTDRTNAGLRKIEGRVSAVPPATAAGTFKIGDRLIGTDASTEFYLNGRNATANDIAVGSRTRVTSMAGTSAILALEVNVVNDQAGGGDSGGGNNGGGNNGGGNNGGGAGGGGNNGGGNNGGGTGDNQETTVTGPISGVLGQCPALSLTIAGTRVHTNLQTRFDLSCLNLLSASGSASATGVKNADGSITASVIKR